MLAQEAQCRFQTNSELMLELHCLQRDSIAQSFASNNPTETLRARHPRSFRQVRYLKNERNPISKNNQHRKKEIAKAKTQENKRLKIYVDTESAECCTK